MVFLGYKVEYLANFKATGEKLAAVITAGLLLLYIPLCYEDFHFHVAHVYARLGYPNAQHILGQRYLQGAGVERNEDMAMHWFSLQAPESFIGHDFCFALDHQGYSPLLNSTGKVGWWRPSSLQGYTDDGHMNGIEKAPLVLHQLIR
ncbi:hypothetical protein llap_17520 [Limosa lapponica baueri]|uniref:Uncharacterized protein n=1 Tax=Limosa lapponica baueri TaxID=1758121 RepID=A0A2I0TEH3_LIMLA|nr:hypothetical protein llap_17520 [Limosa lapponica baueri]